MKNQKSPIKAVYLNVIFPGLGLAYLGRWGYALLFFLWTPLRLILGIAIINSIPFSRFLGSFGIVAQFIIAFAWWAYIMYDTCTMPYEMAIEQNQKAVSNPAQEINGMNI